MPQKTSQDRFPDRDKASDFGEKQGKERAARRAAITKAWCGSIDARTFIAALEREGYYLARNDEHSYVVVDLSGEAHSITRQIEGAKSKEIKERLAGIPLEELPDVQDARDQVKQRETDQPCFLDTSSFTSPALACVPYALLILSVLLAYSNVYHNDFLFDDLMAIKYNTFLKSWHYLGTLFVTHLNQGSASIDPFYRPLQVLLYLFVYQSAGLSTIAFHLLNITLHVVNACLLYTLGVRLGFTRIAVLPAALLWAIHPVQTEAVTYMSCTGDLLCGVFLFSGILVLAREFSFGRTLWTCLLFALALLSKETAATFPLLTMGLLFYQSENRWSPRTYLNTWPFWLMLGLYLVMRATILNFSGVFGFYDSADAANENIVNRVYTSLATLPTYLRLLVWPTGLHMERSFPVSMTFWTPQVVAGFGIVAGAFTTIVWKPAQRATPLAWGMLWAAALYIPVSGILVRTQSLIAERWLYLPTAGLSLGVLASFSRLSWPVTTNKISQILSAGFFLLAASFGVMTFEQNKIWRDSFVFYKHIFECGEDSPAARNNLGLAYQEKGQYSLAVEQYRRALTFSDQQPEPHYNLAVTLLLLDQTAPTIAESIKHFRRTLQLNPDYYKANDMLGVIYDHTGNPDAASDARAKSAEIRRRLGI